MNDVAVNHRDFTSKATKPSLARCVNDVAVNHRDFTSIATKPSLARCVNTTKSSVTLLSAEFTKTFYFLQELLDYRCEEIRDSYCELVSDHLCAVKDKIRHVVMGLTLFFGI